MLIEHYVIERTLDWSLCYVRNRSSIDWSLCYAFILKYSGIFKIEISFRMHRIETYMLENRTSITQSQITRRKELHDVKKQPSKPLFQVTLTAHDFNRNKLLRS